MTCSGSQSLLVVDLGFTHRQCGSRVCALKNSDAFLVFAVLVPANKMCSVSGAMLPNDGICRAKFYKD